MVAKDREGLKVDIAKLAMPVLVERLGGLVTISEDEYEALWARYGGRDRVAVRAEYSKASGQLTLTLFSTSPPVGSQPA